MACSVSATRLPDTPHARPREPVGPAFLPQTHLPFTGREETHLPPVGRHFSGSETRGDPCPPAWWPCTNNRIQMLVQELSFPTDSRWSTRQRPTNSCPGYPVQLTRVSQLLMWCLKFLVTWENNPEHLSLCPEDPWAAAHQCTCTRTGTGGSLAPWTAGAGAGAELM